MSKITQLAWVSAAALAVFVVWLATDIGASAGIGFIYAVPVGLAAWWGGRRWAAAAVVACGALYVVGAAIKPVPDFAVALSLRLAVFVGVAVLVSSIRERLIGLEHAAEELEDIQAALTPSKLLDLPDVDAAAAFVPSDHGVSGDFYLLTNGPDESTVAIVGDVVGHGPDAARLATFIRARFAAFVANTSDPGELLMLTNTALIDQPGPEHELVSAACVRWRTDEARLSWAVAGHPPPLRLPRLQELRAEGPTFLLGARPDLELRTAEISLGSDEGVLIYTDGATDVRQSGAQLGLAGLSMLLEPLARQSPWELTAQLEKAILDWADESLRDDLCLFALRPKAARPVS
jgi:serine phosphatase RsbU (regulator of sigma subunit)